MGRARRGKRLGFNKNFDVQSGDWELSWLAGASRDGTTRVPGGNSPASIIVYSPSIILPT